MPEALHTSGWGHHEFLTGDPFWLGSMEGCNISEIVT